MGRERTRQRKPVLLHDSGIAAGVPEQRSILTTLPPRKHGHVLLIEDSSLVVDALRLLLEEHGYEVTTADSIRSARAAVAQRPPNIVLLDIALPDGDGLELARDWAPTRTMVVIALTGYADEETRAHCLKAGCRAVLVKPVPIADLLHQLDSLKV